MAALSATATATVVNDTQQADQKHDRCNSGYYSHHPKPHLQALHAVLKAYDRDFREPWRHGDGECGAAAAAAMAEVGKNGNLHARWNPACDRFDAFCYCRGVTLIAYVLHRSCSPRCSVHRHAL